MRPNQSADGDGVNVGNDLIGNVITGYPIEQHIADLKRLERRLRRDLGRAHRAEQDLLKEQLATVREKLRDVNASYDERLRELLNTKEALEKLSEQMPEARLQAALKALNSGDTSLAESLLIEIEANAAASLESVAEAAFQIGLLRESALNLSDALKFFERSACVQPNYERLLRIITYYNNRKIYYAAKYFASRLLVYVRNHHEIISIESSISHRMMASIEMQFDIKSAEIFAETACNVAFPLRNSNPEVYHASMRVFAGILQNTDQLQRAREIIESDLDFIGNLYGKTSNEYAASLTFLGAQYEAEQRSDQAAKIYLEAASIHEKNEITLDHGYQVILLSILQYREYIDSDTFERYATELQRIQRELGEI